MNATSAYKRSRRPSGIIAARAEILAAGAQPTHPLAAPTVSGTSITVDTMINQPTRITRMIMDLTLQRFIADRVFAGGGGVSGGAVVYDEATLNEIYATRDAERVAVGGVFPIITSDRQVPKVKEVEKWGGKVWISDEARDRNQAALFSNQVRQLSNTIVRKLNQRAIEVLEASITASGQTAVGRNWSTASDVGPDASTTTRQNLPLRDFALAQRMADEDELGVQYTLWLLNPQEYGNLIVLYGASGLRQLLSDMNIDIYVSMRVPAGTAYVVAGQSTGEMRIEKPLSTETWREPERERTWIQASVRPVMFVTNPYAVLKFTGLAG